MSRQTVTHYAEKVAVSGFPPVGLRAMNDAELTAVMYPAPASGQPKETDRRKDLNLFAELNRTRITRLLLEQE